MAFLKPQADPAYDYTVRAKLSGVEAEEIDGSVIKSIVCLSRGSRLSSQNPHGGSQLSVAPVAGDLIPSSGLCV